MHVVTDRTVCLNRPEGGCRAAVAAASWELEVHNAELHCVKLI
jgi:hypothetical protein